LAYSHISPSIPSLAPPQSLPSAPSPASCRQSCAPARASLALFLMRVPVTRPPSPLPGQPCNVTGAPPPSCGAHSMWRYSPAPPSSSASPSSPEVNTRFGGRCCPPPPDPSLCSIGYGCVWKQRW
jgi:hypothetical protein